MMLPKDLKAALKAQSVSEQVLVLNHFAEMQLCESSKPEEWLKDFNVSLRQDFPHLIHQPVPLDAFFALFDDAEPLDLYEVVQQTAPKTVNPYQLFSLIESDGITDIAPSHHWVNRVGYIISDKPFYLDCVFSDAMDN